MSHPDSHDGRPARNQPSLGETIDRANQVIEEARAEIARSRILSQSEADLSRDIRNLNQELDRLNGSRKDGA
jgi:hypothetical protein